METTDTRQRSRRILEGRDRAGARAMLKAIGFDDEDLGKPIVGVAHTWIETMPCNFNQRRLAERVKEGVREAGGTPMGANNISGSDGVTMGNEGMKASVLRREGRADSIELVGRGHMFDALVCLVGCDKTIPAGAMALLRLDVPGVVIYGGSIAPGRFHDRDVTIQDVYEAIGAHAVGRMSDRDFKDLEDHACPGAGACGGQYTANTMALALTFLGLSPMGSADPPANDARKDDVSAEAGRLVMDLLSLGLKPSDILTRESFENAIAAVAATGGSTNAVLHLLALAREANVPLGIDDFDRVSGRTPIIADLKPGGRYVAVDMDRAGGSKLLGKRMLEAGLPPGRRRATNGRTLVEGGEEAPEAPGPEGLWPGGGGGRGSGGLAILKGNLAPEGCVVKVAGYTRLEHRSEERRVGKECRSRWSP